MPDAHSSGICAVVAAAGRSRRMGRPKQLLAWGNESVISRVVRNLSGAGAAPIYVVVGHAADEIKARLRPLPPDIEYDVVYNQAYRTGEMLSSYQKGVMEAAQRPDIFGTLLALGDQPQIPVHTIRQVVEAAASAPEAIWIPSYCRRRGHPIYIPRRLWTNLIDLRPDESLRVLLHEHADAIAYVDVGDASILRDLDTPEDYESLSQSI